MEKKVNEKEELLEQLEVKLGEKYPDRLVMGRITTKIIDVLENEGGGVLPIPMQLGILDTIKFEIWKKLLLVSDITDDDTVEQMYEEQLKRK